MILLWFSKPKKIGNRIVISLRQNTQRKHNYATYFFQEKNINEIQISLQISSQWNHDFIERKLYSEKRYLGIFGEREGEKLVNEEQGLGRRAVEEGKEEGCEGEQFRRRRVGEERRGSRVSGRQTREREE